jgi:hypothetical protein
MTQRTGRAAVVCLAALGFLHGCGGGGSDSGSTGGSSNPPPTSSPQTPMAQSIAFVGGGPLNKVFGDADFTNVATGGNGAGALTYASSNTAVAIVDTSTGKVTIVAVGTAEITASKAADSAYLGAQATYTVNVSKAPQALAFRDPGPLSNKVGHAEFTDDASGGAGTGAISYATSDPTIATVEASTGEVTLKGVGTAQITATKAEDSNYLAAQASFTLNVSPSHTDTFTALLGTADTLASFPTTAVGDQFVRSTVGSCDVTAPLACPMGHSDVLTASPVTDNVVQLNRNGWYWLTHGTDLGHGVPVTNSRFFGLADLQLVNFAGKLWVLGGDYIGNNVWSSVDGRAWTSSQSLPPLGQQPFTSRSGLRAVSFNGKLWVVGGYGGPSKPYNDVWSSSDGTNWTQVTPAAAFPARLWHQVVTFSGRMWLIGGQDPQTLAYFNDIWSSPDGATWTRVNAATPFSARSGHRAVAFNGKLWVIGGSNINTYYNDVWSSVDGVNWTSAVAPFPARSDHRVASYDNKLWVVGGGNGTTLFNDVWSSPDGTNWTSVSQGAPFSPRQGLAMAAFVNKLWVVGGDESTLVNCCDRNDIWSTADGATWNYEQTESPFQPIGTQHAMQLNQRLWVVSGTRDPKFPTQIWGSADGDTWVRATAAAIPARGQYATAVLGGSLWLVGGRTGANVNTGLNDVWSSANGADWTKNTAAAPFSPRFAHQLVGFHGRLRLIGGIDASGSANADVWSSSDGVTWTQDVVAAPFGVRSYHQVIEFNDMLWLIGGAGGNNPPTDIWSSSDGVTWTEATSAAEFGTRMFTQVIAANGQLWVIGGYRLTNVYLNDVWSSTDGAHWTQVTAAAAFEPREGHSSGTLNGRLFIFGGGNVVSSEQRANEIWSSTDGALWRLRYQNQIELPR